MPNRIIKESIRTSKDINALTDFQFRVWTYLLTYVDDYGRGSADAELLKGLCFPRRKGVTEKQIADALSMLANTGMIDLYEVDGELYFCFPTWEKHQTIRAKKSKFPAPDSTCKQMQADASKCPRNTIQSNPNPIQSESEKDRAPRFMPPSVDEVRQYCLERRNHVDPEYFVDFYAKKGWMVGKSPMKDWRAAVRNFERNGWGPQQTQPVSSPSKYAKVRTN